MTRLNNISPSDGARALKQFAQDAIEHLTKKMIDNPDRAPAYKGTISVLRMSLDNEITYAARAEVIAQKKKTKYADDNRYITCFMEAVNRLKDDMIPLTQKEKEELI